MKKVNLISSLLLSLLLAGPAVAEGNREVDEVKKEVKAADKHAGIDIKVNINTASADEIATLLTGVGVKKARQIVEYRDSNGLFKNIDDLKKVKGIGQATLKKNEGRIEL